MLRVKAKNTIRKAQAKFRRMVANYKNEFSDKKCMRIKSYFGSEKCSEFWKFIKNIRSSNSGRSQLNLISADTR